MVYWWIFLSITYKSSAKEQSPTETDKYLHISYSIMGWNCLILYVLKFIHFPHEKWEIWLLKPYHIQDYLSKIMLVFHNIEGKFILKFYKLL
jgi:hypothetical protein